MLINESFRLSSQFDRDQRWPVSFKKREFLNVAKIKKNNHNNNNNNNNNGKAKSGKESYSVSDGKMRA